MPACTCRERDDQRAAGAGFDADSGPIASGNGTRRRVQPRLRPSVEEISFGREASQIS